MMFSIYFPHSAQAEFPGVQGYAANKTCILHVPVKLTQTHKNHFLISLATYFYLHVCTSHYFQLCTNSICSRCNKSGLLACVHRHRSWCLWERLQVSPTEASGVWLCRKWMRVAALREQSMESRCNAVLQTSWGSHNDRLLALMSLQTCVTSFLLQNSEEQCLKNADVQFTFFFYIFRNIIFFCST